MAVISTNSFTQRMSRRLRAAGRNEWVAESDGDAWGKYLIFRVGGRCIAGAGWTRRECEEIVNKRCAVARPGDADPAARFADLLDSEQDAVAEAEARRGYSEK